MSDDGWGDEVTVIEDLAEPIVAYRRFNVKDINLTSVTKTLIWPPAKAGGMEAECMEGKEGFKNLKPPCVYPHPSHNNGFGCGLYAAKTIDELNTRNWGGQVLARVLIGGRVHEHVHGYRAQYGAIDALYRGTRPFPIYMFGFPAAPLPPINLEKIAEHYGVELLDQPPLQSPKMSKEG